jgi:malonyl-CoA/methylmalonyl-CoA synthetase
MFPDPSEWLERVPPDRLFLATPDGQQFTYAELLDETGLIATALQGLGVVPADRIAVRVEKSATAVFLYVACLRLGAVFVPVNTAYSAAEVEYFLTDSKPRVAVVDPADVATLAPLGLVQHILTMDAQGSGSLMDLAWRSDPDISPATRQFVPPQGLAAGAPAAIIYTSGTTGRSKGAVLTRENLASNAETLAAAWRFTSDDVLLHVLPLFHVHGLFAAINTVLASGSSMILLPTKFDGADAVRRLNDVTVFMGVPTHYTRLLQEQGLNRDATSRMRLFVSGSAPLLAETHQEFSHRTGHHILERYGMTETLMNTSNPYDGARVPGSVGPPLPGVQVRVINPESGAVETTPDAIGTLEIKGPNVFSGYWQAPEKTAQEFTADGWFKTGDLGKIDANGYIHIVGRVKDLVISGGYNVYPKEVETELDAIPGVVESAVFGVPHPDFGEGVTAAVVLQPGAQLTEAGILDAVRSRLARYKLPKRILLMQELPRNTMGKVQKNVLRAANDSLYVPSAPQAKRP